MAKATTNSCGSSYDRGCRCVECKETNRIKKREYEFLRRTIDVASGEFTRELTVEYEIPAQVINQLRTDAGLTYKDIGERTGFDPATLCRIATGKRRRVHRRTADILYDLQAQVEAERPDLAEKWY